ncbi:hypothetical protein HWV62_6535 [Athelia sp. TMB]|nr:hypothetical protein HWV62_6535 [Athelia sp. TMB]
MPSGSTQTASIDVAGEESMEVWMQSALAVVARSRAGASFPKWSSTSFHKSSTPMTCRLSTQALWRLSARNYGAKRSFSLVESLRRNAPIDIHPEVADALANNKPVVALETALVTNGMPYPENLETARSEERIVRTTGSIPATIAVLGGRIKIGLEDAEVEHLATAKSAVKVSRRDIGPVISQRMDGGTTISATLIFAALAGIKVFATGGLGGVHRGGENTMDVSADLHELSRYPVGLVSAGVKSILDIGRTLEYLVGLFLVIRASSTHPYEQETLGVPVISYSKTNDFPAFFSTKSGFKTPWRVDDPASAANILFTQWQLGMNNGALFGVPIPEEYEAAGAKLQEAVDLAVAEADQNGVSKRGKEATPWLLRRVAELTAGGSLKSNIALIENTALVGGRIAAEYAKLVGSQSDGGDTGTAHYFERGSSQNVISGLVAPNPTTRVAEVAVDLAPASDPPAELIIVGCAAIDISATTVTDSILDLHSTSPGSVEMSLGGVARNIAEAAHRLSGSHSTGSPSKALLISPVGDDAFGRVILEETKLIGMRDDGLIQLPKARSAVCNMLLSSTGNLTGGVADMDIIKSLPADMILRKLAKHHPAIVALDANLSEQTLKELLKYCNVNTIDVLFEPTSIVKSTSIFSAIASSPDFSAQRSPVSYATPNLLELAHMYQAARDDVFELTSHPSWWQTIDNFAISHQFRMELEHLARRPVSDEDNSKGTLSFLLADGIAQMAINLLPFFSSLIIKCGDRGLVLVLRISDPAKWSKEYSNVHRRRIVAHGKTEQDIVVLQHIPPLPLAKDSIKNVTGAGDTLVGSLLSSLLRHPDMFSDPDLLFNGMHAAQTAAIMTLQSRKAVSPLLSPIISR